MSKQTIILFGGGPAFGLPEVSPYVTKTEVQLKMAEIPYTKEFARPDASPKGQLPFIEDDGQRIADLPFRERFRKFEFFVWCFVLFSVTRLHKEN